MTDAQITKIMEEGRRRRERAAQGYFGKVKIAPPVRDKSKDNTGCFKGQYDTDHSMYRGDK